MTHLINLFRTAAVFALVLLAALSGWASPGGDDWPTWGGRHGNFTVTPGVIKGEQPLALKIAWKKELGSGYSAISVLDGMAVTMFSDSTFDYTIALNVEDGSELWRFKIGPTFPGRFGSANGPISTPLISDRKVVGLSAAGRLFALDRESGELVWDSDLVSDHQAEIPFYMEYLRDRETLKPGSERDDHHPAGTDSASEAESATAESGTPECE